ncbi:putative serine--tRNA ligase [Dictyocaulus viviparus]|uniref:Putative serine--tRNA ligase n=1 Tax=Dictyocaulus viviparus TaxID=29172 RepID=A0A0D8XVV6_DICVI|nr:putative serine--tRNA ligase [Dictyocaulus viviparus]
MVDSSDLLLSLDHVKYRKSGDGRSPIGRLLLYKEHVEWRDDAGPEVLFIKFMQIKGQRVSPPNKSKVQLQLVLQNDEQSTFVFLNPTLDKEGLIKERDLLKETLQQALIAHRQRVNQLAAANEHDVKQTELREKQRILGENKHLDQLYTHLVASKLISAQDFWTDYYGSGGVTEGKTGVSGAFLSNIVQQEGTNGIKLNLNTEIIQAVFNTYPAVEKKHLELVPHEMTETQFWTKFFQSHYFHREREVLPSPNDPFSDCVKMDEAEMEKIHRDGVFRKRFDLEHLTDNVLNDFGKSDESKTHQYNTLVRRCNYLSEKILVDSKPTCVKDSIGDASRLIGFSVLNRLIEEDENRLESNELVEQFSQYDRQMLDINTDHGGVDRSYPSEEAANYKDIVLTLLESSSDEDILIPEDGDLDILDMEASDVCGTDSESVLDCSDPFDWGLSSAQFNELRAVHDAVAELLKHFWLCFPPITQELEDKLQRMAQTLLHYESNQLHDAEQHFGRKNVEHCYHMLAKAQARFKVYSQRKYVIFVSVAQTNKCRYCMIEQMRHTFTTAVIVDRSIKLFNLLKVSKYQFRYICNASRPELDFEFLLDDSNLEDIRRNITERKCVGDIDALRTKWNELKTIIDARKKSVISEKQLERMWDDFYAEAMRIPNMSHPDVPKGNYENARVLCSWGKKREDVCMLAEELIKSWRTLFHPVDASGEKSYAFVGAIANLERALIDYVFDRLCVLDFKPVSVSDLVSRKITEACGVFQTHSKSLQYSLQNEPDVALSGTGEMGIAAYMQNQTIDEERLPLRLVTMSRCYRPELSNSAREAKLYRVHEFNKVCVHYFILCSLTRVSHFQIEIQLDMPTEDLGPPAARKVDIEVWMPGRKIFGELSSASNCTDYQARRLNIRYRTRSGEVKFVNTCNGTAVASARTLIGLLESFQTDRKGLDDLPEVIRSRLKTVRPHPVKFQSAKPLL